MGSQDSEGEHPPTRSSNAPKSGTDARARSLLEQGFRRQSDIVDERVRHIRRMMAQGQWFGVSTEQLAVEWGVSVGAIKGYAAEAARQRRQAHEAIEEQELYSATLGRLDRLSAAAEASGELRTAVRAEAEKAKIAGLVRSDVRAVVLVPIGGTELKATVEELRGLLGHVDAFLREKYPHVAAELAAHLIEVRA